MFYNTGIPKKIFCAWILFWKIVNTLYLAESNNHCVYIGNIKIFYFQGSQTLVLLPQWLLTIFLQIQSLHRPANLVAPCCSDWSEEAGLWTLWTYRLLKKAAHSQIRSVSFSREIVFNIKLTMYVHFQSDFILCIHVEMNKVLKPTLIIYIHNIPVMVDSMF